MSRNAPKGSSTSSGQELSRVGELESLAREVSVFEDAVVLGTGGSA